jgi:hypothetical protein
MLFSIMFKFMIVFVSYSTKNNVTIPSNIIIELTMLCYFVLEESIELKKQNKGSHHLRGDLYKYGRNYICSMINKASLIISKIVIQ